MDEGSQPLGVAQVPAQGPFGRGGLIGLASLGIHQPAEEALARWSCDSFMDVAMHLGLL